MADGGWLSNPQAQDAVREYQRRCCERSFKIFVREAWPVIEPSTPLVWNWHMGILCGYLEALAFGHLVEPRLIVNVPPGTSKSLLVSVLYPSWIWTRDAGHRFLTTSNDGSIVVRDALKQRFLVQTEWYQGLWGQEVQPDTSQWDKTLFQTTKLGFRQAVPLRGTVTGKRGDTQIIDDPHDSKKAFSDVEIATDLQAYDQAFSTRVNNATSSRRLLIMQRLRTNDLTGHLLSKTKQHWVQVCIPMRYEGEQGFDVDRDIKPQYRARYRHLRDPRTKKGELLDPVRFPEAAVKALAEDLGEYGEAGQLQQRPQPQGGGIIAAKRWKVWPDDQPLPKLRHVFASWDTAFSEKDLERTAYSVCTVWGVWRDERDIPTEARGADGRLDEHHPDALGRAKLLLLSAWWDRVDWDDLLDQAVIIEKKKLKGSRDAHLIEAKASGQSLIQAMRKRTRVRVIGYDPKADGGGDKVARAYLSQPAFSAGLIWRPNREWAKQAADKVAEFPAGDALSADMTDTVTQAINFLVKGWWLSHPDDAKALHEQQAFGPQSELPFDLRNDEREKTESSGFYG